MKCNFENHADSHVFVCLKKCHVCLKKCMRALQELLCRGSKPKLAVAFEERLKRQALYGGQN